MFMPGSYVELASRHFIQTGEDQMQDVAAALKLVRSDGREGEQDSNGPQDACGGVIAGLQQVGDGELGELARPWRNDQNHQQPNPATGRLPQGREAVLEGILSAAKQAAGADPGREQRK